MRLGTGLTGAKLAFLAWFGPTRGAPNLKCLFFGDFHGYIMGVYRAGIWSILTSKYKNENESVGTLVNARPQ